MDLRTLQYFDAVANLLSFSNAAKSLYISQSTLSQQIKALEDELGTPLIIRQPRSIALTDAGKRLHNRAKELLFRADQIKKDLCGAENEPSFMESLTVGFSSDQIENVIIRHAMCSAAHELRSRHAGLALAFVEYKMQDFKDTLFGNQADICIASWHTPPEIQLLESDVIWKEPLVVAAKRGTTVPSTKAEFCQLLMSHDIYMFSRNVDALSYAIDLFSKLSIMPSLRFFDNSHLPLLAAESGEALMILPQSVFQRTNSMDLIPIDFCGIETEIQTFVFWKKTNNNSMISKFCYLMQSALTALRV